MCTPGSACGALRRYDAMGLLPARIDPVNGYRWYSADQIGRARRIALLRSVGMPLRHIAEVLDLDGPAAAEAVDRWWAAQEAAISDRRLLVRVLVDSLHGRTSTMFPITTRDVPERQLLTITGRLTADAVEPFVDDGFGRLTSHLADHGITPERPSLMVFHGAVSEDSDGPLELCVPFRGTVETATGIEVRVEPAHREAFTTVTRDQWAYPAILEAYEAVADWVCAHGSADPAPLPCREVYPRPVDGIEGDAPICEIAFPYVAG